MNRLLIAILFGLSNVPSSISDWDRCGGRLERALDSMQRESSRRNRLDDDDTGVVYQRKLSSAPLEMIVAQVAVKVPHHPGTNRDDSWARVDKCHYEPGNNSLRSRVMFNDLSVSGLISLVPNNRRGSTPSIGETCRMSLRLRRAGVEFFTNPIARTRGQMRIRTESSFLEPRFASIYAYGCRPVNRMDKQIKRQDKPSSTSSSSDAFYEAAEPRKQVEPSTKEEDVVIANESSSSGYSYARFDLLPNKKTFWITKLPEIKRKKRSNVSIDLDEYSDGSRDKMYHYYLDDPVYNMADWMAKDDVAREMEDVFLRGASEALTRYIEKELHPAIKETLMVSMGYTISYG